MKKGFRAGNQAKECDTARDGQAQDGDFPAGDENERAFHAAMHPGGRSDSHDRWLGANFANTLRAHRNVGRHPAFAVWNRNDAPF